MAKRLSTNEAVLLSVKIPKPLYKALDEFRLAHGLKNRSETCRLILERGLANDKPGPIPRITKSQPGRMEKCLHPVARRIGTYCADCGATVGGR